MITKEQVLAKFGGDEAKADAFMEAFVISQKSKLKETQALFNPNGKFMRFIAEQLESSLISPWKRVLNKFTK